NVLGKGTAVHRDGHAVARPVMKGDAPRGLVQRREGKTADFARLESGDDERETGAVLALLQLRRVDQSRFVLHGQAPAARGHRRLSPRKLAAGRRPPARVQTRLDDDSTSVRNAAQGSTSPFKASRPGGSPRQLPAAKVETCPNLAMLAH